MNTVLQIARDKAKRPEKTAKIEGFDNQEVLVRGLFGDLRWTIMETSMIDKGQGAKSIDILRLFPRLAIECLFDVETRSPIFTKDDESTLDEQSLDTKSEIMDLIMGVSGLGEDSIDEAKSD